MLGVIDILIYGLARHAKLFCNLGVADAFSMQFQNLYDLVGGKLRLAARIARIWMIDFQHLCKFSQFIQIRCAKNFFYLLLVIARHPVSLPSRFLLLLYRDFGEMSIN